MTENPSFSEFGSIFSIIMLFSSILNEFSIRNIFYGLVIIKLEIDTSLTP